MVSARLDRFRTEQDGEIVGFTQALNELRTTGKRNHWIWYIFPQLAGLGSSSMARAFGLQGVDEATAYLLDPTLQSRLHECTRAVLDRLQEGMRLTRIMGSEIDALKLVSSLTLFEAVAISLGSEHESFAAVARDVLARAEAQGFPRCAFTLRALGAASPS